MTNTELADALEKHSDYGNPPGLNDLLADAAARLRKLGDDAHEEIPEHLRRYVRDGARCVLCNKRMYGLESGHQSCESCQEKLQ